MVGCLSAWCALFGNNNTISNLLSMYYLDYGEHLLSRAIVHTFSPVMSMLYSLAHMETQKNLTLMSERCQVLLIT